MSYGKIFNQFWPAGGPSTSKTSMFYLSIFCSSFFGSSKLTSLSLSSNCSLSFSKSFTAELSSSYSWSPLPLFAFHFLKPKKPNTPRPKRMIMTMMITTAPPPPSSSSTPPKLAKIYVHHLYLAIHSKYFY